ncbi:hypothetical protein [Maridesulfovibrio sp.]|uniref:hypothetical protein n=1 Tax=Maridesulfovibrio sp. TaxID=2795000 RepID=UPI002A18D083|nr:hypothetical protein [Maridesulfovibrio sp.]
MKNNSKPPIRLFYGGVGIFLTIYGITQIIIDAPPIKLLPIFHKFYSLAGFTGLVALTICTIKIHIINKTLQATKPAIYILEILTFSTFIIFSHLLDTPLISLPLKLTIASIAWFIVNIGLTQAIPNKSRKREIIYGASSMTGLASGLLICGEALF